jgi:hypothetical protein
MRDDRPSDHNIGCVGSEVNGEQVRQLRSTSKRFNGIATYSAERSGMVRSLIVLLDDSAGPILAALEGASRTLRVKMFQFRDECARLPYAVCVKIRNIAHDEVVPVERDRIAFLAVAGRRYD